MSDLMLGAAGFVFTPPLETLLAGFGFRDHGAESVLDDLEIRLFLLTQGRESVCIIVGDAIGFGAEITHALRQEAYEIAGIAPEKVLLCASHTHYGPQLLSHLPGAGGALNTDVIADIQEKTRAALQEALQNLSVVKLSWGESSLTGYAINRRWKTENGIDMRPNPFGKRDDSVTAIHFCDASNGTLRALLFSYTCHPTVQSGYGISADYPGAARRILEEQTGAVAGFLPGCFGDIRPNCAVLGNTAFRKGTHAEAQSFGKALAAAITDAGTRPNQLTPQIGGVCEDAILPLQAEGDSRKLPIQRIDLAEEFSIVAMGGEICVEYGYFAKNLSSSKRILPLGYSNDVIAYVPTARMIADGGYEAERSCPWFSLPGPFKPEIEEIVKNTIQKIVNKKL